MKKKIMLLIAGALALFLVAGHTKKAEANYCVQYAGAFCIAYAPTPPASFSPTNGDNNAYGGEFLICTDNNCGASGGWCAWAAPGPTINDASLGEFDGAWGNFHIRSFKNNTSGTNGPDVLYDGTNYGGPNTAAIVGNTGNTCQAWNASWNISSLQIHN